MLDRQSSKSSTRSSSSALQKRVQEFMITRDEEEFKNQIKYADRRRKRKMMKKTVKKRSNMKRIRLFYVPALMGFVCGSVMLFCAGIRAVGGDTIFWTHREEFLVAGSVVLALGVLFLMLAAGLESRETEKIKKNGLHMSVCSEPKHPDFVKEDLSRQSSCNSSRGSYSNIHSLSKTAEHKRLLSPDLMYKRITLDPNLPPAPNAIYPNHSFVTKWAQVLSMNTNARLPVLSSPLNSPRLSPRCNKGFDKDTGDISGVTVTLNKKQVIPKIVFDFVSEGSENSSTCNLQDISEENSFEEETRC